MRILLDECVPRRLRAHFQGHDAHTVQMMGWTGKKNGELMALTAGAGFEALITVDRNLQYQQNVSALPFGILVLVAPSNRISDLLPLIPNALIGLQKLQPGTCIEIQ
jgi:predicted nuclease of predicted toxin-antitoxin system